MVTRTVHRLACFLLLVVTCLGIPSISWAADSPSAETQPPRPNILWITAEDMCPQLACYGDPYATTPNLDRLASEGVRYSHAFATAPVCSPARSCLITGIYATSLGTQNLRSVFPIPDTVPGFPTYLRAAGYYCTNNEKTDYNTANEPALIKASWDECSAKAHWRNRRAGQPFFSVFNLLVTHQSRTSAWRYEQFEKMINALLKREERHDPGAAPVPPFYPDTPVARRTLARYYDCITAMDKEVGRILEELNREGLADDTIVFFYGDNGMGLPRGKRTLYDTGLRVPLITRFPKKYQYLAAASPGETFDRLVSFVDFAPTVLSLAGLQIPQHMQGIPFLGSKAGPPRGFVYGARDRVDEAYEVSRSVRDVRFLYIRNYTSHRSWNQPESFSDTAEVRQEITRLAEEGRLSEAQLTYAGPTKPMEELYDSQADPYQISNLVQSPQHGQVLDRLRRAHEQWLVETRDVGFLTEAECWSRSEGTTPRALARDERRYPLLRIISAARLVGNRGAAEEQIRLLSDSDSAVRYWAVVGLRAAGGGAEEAKEPLRRALADSSPSVRIEAAGALAKLGEIGTALPVLVKELQSTQLDNALHAARTLQLLGKQAVPALPAMKRVLEQAKKPLQAAPQYLFLQFSLEAAIQRLSS